MSNFVPGLIPPPPQTSAPINELRTRVDALLTIFDDPRYAPLDVPDWVHRATAQLPTSFFNPPFTVRGLIRALRDSAAELGLENGERYVLEAVCACANDAAVLSPAQSSTEWHADGTSGETLARCLQHLANAWVAFLLWPFFAQMEDLDNSATGLASPCIGLAFTPKAMAAGYVNPNAGSRVGATSYPLREEVLRRDGYKCVVSGAWDMSYYDLSTRTDLDGEQAWTDAVRIFKHPLVVYKEIYDVDEMKRKSTMLSMELLHRYSQLSDRYIRDLGSGVMDDPANLITLNVLGHVKFDHFGFCFVPTQTPNTYKVIDHRPRTCGMPSDSSPMPETVTFEDHTARTGASIDVNGSPPAGSPHVVLPDPELMRTHALLGSVLYKSGLVYIFTRLVLAPDTEGGLPLSTPDGVSFWNSVVGSDERMLDRLVQCFEALHVA